MTFKTGDLTSGQQQALIVHDRILLSARYNGLRNSSIQEEVQSNYKSQYAKRFKYRRPGVQI